ncbi:hypothetical protein DCS_05825 [Drechmeria coniospora]|uniref:Uncharacterized protein n=1 Tax=Drechmeria coniospora TaxID=98403 RepID=A0A151GNW1_DRECN|nr:hypothetical protein DCS_05825 [Drechmeria coniospora]KYK58807.1 hypothetical protein DCS_05825 [Drechmeria coniospora]
MSSWLMDDYKRETNACEEFPLAIAQVPEVCMYGLDGIPTAELAWGVNSAIISVVVGAAIISVVVGAAFISVPAVWPRASTFESDDG